MDLIPIEIENRIILYNSTILCDIFKTRIKKNSLMILFRRNNGTYKRLWHYLQDIHGDKWSKWIDYRIKIGFDKG